MPQAAPVAPAASALPVGVPGASITPKFQVRARFARRMRVQRVYPLIVELRPEKPGASGVAPGDAVIARPLVPGAHVQPLEQELSPRAANNTVTFSVTPLAAGKLKGARVQILHSGRVLDEVWTPIRGIRPGRFLLWGALALVALLYLINILGPLPNLSTGASADPAGKTVDSAVLDKLPDYLNKEELPEEVQDHVSRGALAVFAQDAYNWVYNLPNLNFYLFAGFLVLALLSLFWNRPVLWKSRRKGKAMLLPQSGESSSNALSFR